MAALVTPLLSESDLNCQQKKCFCHFAAAEMPITAEQFRIYFRLCNLARNTSVVWESKSGLARRFGISRCTLNEAIRRLVELRMLRPIANPKNTQLTIWIVTSAEVWDRGDMEPKWPDSEAPLKDADSSNPTGSATDQVPDQQLIRSYNTKKERKNREVNKCVQPPKPVPDLSPDEAAHTNSDPDFCQARELASDWLAHINEYQPATVSGTIKDYERAIRKLCLRHGHSEVIVRDVWEYSKLDRYWKYQMPTPMMLLNKCRDGRWRYEKLCAEVAKPGSYLHGLLLQAKERGVE